MRTFDQKLAAAEVEMARAGIPESQSNPVGQRMLTKMGLQFRPAFYAPFGPLAAVLGVMFGMVWAICMQISSWSSDISFLGRIGAALFAGALFGLGMAAITKYRARKMKLSQWDDL